MEFSGSTYLPTTIRAQVPYPLSQESMIMRFYTQQHRFYCGIDLHARLLAVCIVDQAGTVVLRKQIPDDQQQLRELLAPYRPDVVLAVECLFAWRIYDVPFCGSFCGSK